MIRRSGLQKNKDSDYLSDSDVQQIAPCEDSLWDF